ncbi:hypothetical protein PC129_g11231 [Phytophthora cactorum]|uniref:Uncharacterized protein n=1 Tax=Phytophthora cactorum TaxID=29920 RepID=A0A8T1D8U4_9STRA|nr:hypothetical protein PC117_g12235 [Phytophthora cactorum]KAG3009656.1 hypothetical protein PC119_g13801 [Phytophthora cactorum]KAG3179490.1 hypothetical protein PC128_g15928 [Phytophthora cactorum]KAG3217952.1 hypothetical protein PC129_g11231 [Phytophthora cactorum]
MVAVGSGAGTEERDAIIKAPTPTPHEPRDNRSRTRISKKLSPIDSIHARRREQPWDCSNPHMCDSNDVEYCNIGFREENLSFVVYTEYCSVPSGYKKFPSLGADRFC